MRSLCAPLPAIVILAVSSFAFGSPTPAPSVEPAEGRIRVIPTTVEVTGCAKEHPNKKGQAYKLCRCAELYPTKTSAEYKICKGIIHARGHITYYVAPIRRRMKYVTPKYVKLLIEEGKRVLAKPQNRWMKLHVLLGLATVESDLSWWLRHIDRRGADCGITQNRVSEPTVVPECAKPGVWRYGCWKKQCKLVATYHKKRQSIRASFELGMKEMNDIRNKWCCLRGDKRVDEKGRQICRGRYWKPGVDQLRCIFNVYNQGPKYAFNWRWRLCRFKKYEFDTTNYVAKRTARCRRITRYYLRALCFAKGYELGRKSKRDCRSARSYYWIKRTYTLPKTRLTSRE